ncbi:MAG: ATP phosphoribosyltransferase regulatory subunit, partial [Patescibacteria group bacterium]
PTFSRYHLGQSFRGENPQKGRSRELTQFDFDTVGSGDPKEDTKVIAAAVKGARAIGLEKAVMQINDRTIFDNLGFSKEQIITIDKIEKIGKEEVEKLVGSLEKLEKVQKTERLEKIFNQLKSEGLKEGKDFVFSPYLARGLNYYTSTIFELKLDNTPGGLSIGGGGRYDNLIGVFAGREIPAVGFSFGVTRIIDLT